MKHTTTLLIYIKYSGIKIKLKYGVLIFVEREKPEDVEKTLAPRAYALFNSKSTLSGFQGIICGQKSSSSQKHSHIF